MNNLINSALSCLLLYIFEISTKFNFIIIIGFKYLNRKIKLYSSLYSSKLISNNLRSYK